jgi:hypothetical protein
MRAWTPLLATIVCVVPANAQVASTWDTCVTRDAPWIADDTTRLRSVDLLLSLPKGWVVHVPTNSTFLLTANSPDYPRFRYRLIVHEPRPIARVEWGAGGGRGCIELSADGRDTLSVLRVGAGRYGDGTPMTVVVRRFLRGRAADVELEWSIRGADATPEELWWPLRVTPVVVRGK